MYVYLYATCEGEQLRLLATDGMLVKRPLVVLDKGTVLTGFREKEWEEKLLYDTKTAVAKATAVSI